MPLLSGLQLFASVQTADVVDPPPGGGERLYACDGGASFGFLGMINDRHAASKVLE